MEIMHVNGILGHFHSQFVARAIDRAALHTAAIGHEHGKRRDDSVAILVGVRVNELLVRADLMRLILGVTRQRQPQARHSFAEARRRQ